MAVDAHIEDRPDQGLIVRDPDILGARPVFRGTRVPVDLLFDNLADGLTLDEILRAYPTLDHKDVVRTLELARKRLLDTAAWCGVFWSTSACRSSWINGSRVSTSGPSP